MREIKFRAYGQIGDRDSRMFEAGTFELKPYTSGIMVPYFHDKPIYGHHLMQFVGLKDKNGVDIYEGDYVRISYNEPFIESVKYDPDYGFTPIQTPVDYDDIHPAPKDIEVIGNIHENPKLDDGGED